MNIHALTRWPGIAVFLAIWTLYFLLLLAMPFRPIYDMAQAICLQILFVVLVCAAWAPFTQMKQPGRFTSEVATLAATGLLLAAIGVACSAVDKFVVQGIDYSDGLALARERMTVAGENRVGVSSLFSVLGHALGSSYFVAVAAVIARPASARLTISVLAASAFLLIAGSVVSAGRSTILLACAFVPALLCIRILVGLRVPRPSASVIAAIMLFLGVAGAFILYMFAARASVHGMSGASYLRDLLPYLGADLADSGARFLEESPVGDLLGFIGAAVAYAIHSAYTFAGIIALPMDDGRILLTHELGLLAKLGAIEPPNTEWVLAGRFPSLPGGLFHDFGLTGLIAGAAALGAAAGLAGKTVQTFPASIVITGAAACVFTCLFLSPLLLAADFMAFPFVVFAFLLVPGISFIVEKLRASGKYVSDVPLMRGHLRKAMLE